MARPKAFDEETALDAAAQVFWSQGFDGTSMSDLETSMQMGRQSIYNAFGDKRALFLRALERYTAWNRGQLAVTLLAPNAGLRTLREYLRSMVERSTEPDVRRGCLVVNSIAEVGDEDTSIAQGCQANEGLVLGAFEHVLSNAVATGELAHDFDVRANARLLVAVTYGASILAKGGGSFDEIWASYQELLDRWT